MEAADADQVRLKELVLKAEEAERRAQKRAVFYTLVPALAAAVLIIFTGQRIRRAQQAQIELVSITRELNQRKADLQATTLELEDKKRALEAVNAGTPGKRATVEYFPKGVDGQKVEEALRQLKFDVTQGQAVVSNAPTNAVWYGKVPCDDAKLVAYALIQNDVKIQRFGPFPTTHQKDGPQIQVGNAPYFAHNNPLTVNDIQKETCD